MDNRLKNLGPPAHAAVVLDVHLGIEFLEATIRERGVAGWNTWKQSMAQTEPNPLVHSGSADRPPSGLMIWLDFNGTDLGGRNLDGIDLTDICLSRASFRGASLRNANFSFCILGNTCFADADLRQTNFQGAIIDAADYSGARFDGAFFEGAIFDLSTPPVGLPPHVASELHRCANAMRDWRLQTVVSWDVPTMGIPARVEVAFNPKF